MQFFDIHTHKSHSEEDVWHIRNIFPGDEVEPFAGKNFYSIGLHPWFLKSPAENNFLLEKVEKVLHFKHVLAVGECGLDKRAGTDFNEQKRVFLEQSRLAEHFRKPVVVHCVKAYNETLQLRKLTGASVPWILHGYSGNAQTSSQLAEAGFLFSFGELLLNEGPKLIGAFLSLPLEKIFLETDESEMGIKAICQIAAKLKGEDIETFCLKIGQNFKNVFLKDELA